MGALTGRTIWVTGAGTGIGLACARQLAQAGGQVILSGRRADVLEEAAAPLRAAGYPVETVTVDVADRSAVAAAAAGILGRHEGIDILVNSAGMNVPKRYWADLSSESFDAVVAANLGGSFHTTAAVLPSMRARRAGLVINIASWAGRFVSALTGPAYNAAKHAVVAMTYSLNMEECRNGIRACVVCPGEVATPILRNRPIPPSEEEMAKMLQAEDVASAVSYVAHAPQHVCINEIVMSPTWNRSYVGGGADLKRPL
jgi:NADP-dependent 3-hydroxy acid dehydrogenase YdfG